MQEKKKNLPVKGIKLGDIFVTKKWLMGFLDEKLNFSLSRM